MKSRSNISLVLGIMLALSGVISIFYTGTLYGIIPTLIGSSLSILGFRKNRTAILIFGHTLIVVGCFMITWGVYLLPYSQPTVLHILGRPLFWGLISLFGGICTNYHGFCQCIRRQNESIKKSSGAA